MKLGKVERRAHDACAYFASNGGGQFTVDWVASRMWRRCARILWHGEKAAHAGGCGYDKLSAVVAEFLHPLVPEVGGCSGAGIRTVIERLDKQGWTLTHDYDAKWEDGFTLKRKEAMPTT